jgi:hypothetical protein
MTAHLGWRGAELDLSFVRGVVQHDQHVTTGKHAPIEPHAGLEIRRDLGRFVSW